MTDFNKKSDLRTLSDRLGLCSTYFFVVKKITPEKFDMIFKRDKNLLKAFDKFVDSMLYLLQRMEDILYIFEDNTSGYGLLMKKLRITKSDKKRYLDQLWQKENFLVFRTREEVDLVAIQLPSIIKWEKIVSYFDKKGQRND